MHMDGGAVSLTMESTMLTEQGGDAVSSSPVQRHPTLRESVAAFQQRLRGPPNHQRQFALCVDSTWCLRGAGFYSITSAEI